MTLYDKGTCAYCGDLMVEHSKADRQQCQHALSRTHPDCDECIHAFRPPSAPHHYSLLCTNVDASDFGTFTSGGCSLGNIGHHAERRDEYYPPSVHPLEPPYVTPGDPPGVTQ